MRATVAAFSAVFLGLITACSGALPTSSPSPILVPPSPTSSPSATPTAPPTATPLAARTFTSNDGRLIIEAPPGAVPDDIELTATLRGQEDLPPELAGIQLRTGFYSLEPDGLTFDQPLKVTRRTAIADMGYDLETDGIPIVTLALRTSDGTWSWLDEQALSVDGSDLVVSGLISHTSGVFGFGGTTFVDASYTDPLFKAPVGGQWGVSGSLDYRATGDPPLFSPPLEPYTNDGVVTFGPGDVGPDGQTFSQAFDCQNPGETWVGVDVRIDNLNNDDFFGTLGLPPVRTEAYVGTTINCIVAPATFAPLALVQPNFCIRSVHEALGRFVSYLYVLIRGSWGSLYMSDIAYFEVQVKGANDGKPVRLEYNPAADAWTGQLGLNSAGTKTIEKLIIHYPDGSSEDITTFVTATLADGEKFTVRYPETDTIGTCPD